MTTLTPEDRARLRDLATKATPGPWWTTRDLRFASVFSGGGSADDLAVGDYFEVADAALIAAARDAVPALLDALDEAEAERDEAVASLDRLHSWTGLMGLLDEHWPESIFPTLPDNAERDAGPRIISLIRRLDAETLRADRAAQEESVLMTSREETISDRLSDAGYTEYAEDEDGGVTWVNAPLGEVLHILRMCATEIEKETR